MRYCWTSIWPNPSHEGIGSVGSSIYLRKVAKYGQYYKHSWSLPLPSESQPALEVTIKEAELAKPVLEVWHLEVTRERVQPHLCHTVATGFTPGTEPVDKPTATDGDVQQQSPGLYSQAPQSASFRHDVTV